MTGAEPEKPEEQEMSFEPKREQAWVDRVESWDWKPHGANTLIKHGQCQSCEHTMTVVVGKDVIARMLAAAGKAAAGARKYAVCNCRVKHPGAPEGEEGCGANGLIARPGAAE